MRIRHARRLIALVTGVIACSHRALPPVAAPVSVAPPTVPPVVAVAPTHWVLPVHVAATAYQGKVVTTLVRDSAGRSRQEQLETRALIIWQLQRDSSGAIRGVGRVDSFSVRGLENALATGAPTPALSNPLDFDAMLDASNARVTARPVLANECDQVEAGATAIVRELLIRVPLTVAVGDRWQDSTAAFVCRAGVPMTVRQRNGYLVQRADEHEGRGELVIRRTIDTQLDGVMRSAWRTVEITGTGHGDETIRIDVVLGSVRTIDGSSTLTLRVSDSARRDQARSQSVVQKTELSFRRAPN